jgi:hypothetical protein
MDLLISDDAKVEISNNVHNLLQAFIDDWQSEPYHQYQNYAEQHYCTIKGQTLVLVHQQIHGFYALNMYVLYSIA